MEDPPPGPLPSPQVEAAVTKKAEAVVDEVRRALPAEKKALALDQRLLLGEVQILLADKRTSYALLRTGVTIGLVPLSIWTVLVATSSLWNPFQVMWLLLPVMGIASLLFITGLYLVFHAWEHLRHTERVLRGLRRSDTMLESLLMHDGPLAPWFTAPRRWPVWSRRRGGA